MKKLIFTLLLSFGFLISQANDEFKTFDPDSLCTVTLETIQGGFCVQATPTGTAPFSFLWSDNTTENFACFNSPVGLCVTVTDATGCVVTACSGGTVTNNCGVDVYANYLPNNTDAVLNAYAWGDSSQAYSYTWSTGETGQNITVNSDGNYCVTIVDASNCEATDCVNVNFSNNPACSVNIDTIGGGNCLTAYASGVAPFTYQWSNGELTQTACSNNPGIDSLCVTITDADGCVATACSVTYGNNNCGVDIDAVYSSNNTQAVLTANPSGGNGPYNYNWANGATSQSLTVTSSGNYCVTIVDASNCVALDCINISISNNPNMCSVSLNQTGGNSCLTAIATGVAPFTYEWSNGQITQTACSNNPFTDSLCVIITDADGCAATACGLVVGPSNCGVDIFN